MTQPKAPVHAGPSKLSPVFEKCRAEGRAALIGYLPVGYPTVEKSIESFETIVRSHIHITEPTRLNWKTRFPS